MRICYQINSTYTFFILSGDKHFIEFSFQRPIASQPGWIAFKWI